MNRSRIETMPTSSPPGNNWHVAVAARGEAAEDLDGLLVRLGGIGSGVMYSATSVVEASAPDAAKRTRSRSVRMPIGRFDDSATITIEPTRRSTMRAAASAMVAERPAVSTPVLMMSATVSALIARGPIVTTIDCNAMPGRRRGRGRTGR